MRYINMQILHLIVCAMSNNFSLMNVQCTHTRQPQMTELHYITQYSYTINVGYTCVKSVYLRTSELNTRII